MKTCCQELFDEIKDYMELRVIALMANHQFSKGHAVKLLRQDLIEKYEYQWVLSDKGME